MGQDHHGNLHGLLHRAPGEQPSALRDFQGDFSEKLRVGQSSYILCCNVLRESGCGRSQLAVNGEPSAVVLPMVQCARNDYCLRAETVSLLRGCGLEDELLW